MQYTTHILQDAFVRGAGSVRDESAIVAWCYRLLRNALVDHYRRGRAEARARVCRGHRVDLGGVKVTTFASEVGITPNNGAVRLHRAHEALRRQLVRSCGTCATHGCLDCTCGGQSGPES